MARKRKYHQGKFTPVNEEKYIGDPAKIVFRSSWERIFAGFCDKHPSIIHWSSETTVVPYVKPTDNKVHRYFIDFIVEMVTKDGTKIIRAIEIKPHAETLPPKKTKRVTKGYLDACATYAINQAKWKAARAFCKKKGWQFSIMTEFELGIKKR